MNRLQEWVKFLRLFHEASPPGKDVKVSSGKYAALKYPSVCRWLKRHPKLLVYHAPMGVARSNMDERLSRHPTRNRERRQVLRSALELIEAGGDDLDMCNESPASFIWIANNKDILATMMRAKSSALSDPSV